MIIKNLLIIKAVFAGRLKIINKYSSILHILIQQTLKFHYLLLLPLRNKTIDSITFLL